MPKEKRERNSDLCREQCPRESRRGHNPLQWGERKTKSHFFVSGVCVPLLTDRRSWELFAARSPGPSQALESPVELPHLGVVPHHCYPRAKMFLELPKTYLCANFCYLRSCEGAPRRWCVLQACPCHAPLRFLSSGVFLLTQLMLMPSDSIT